MGDEDNGGLRAAAALGFPKAKPPHPYATFIASRRPEFKTHSGIGHVKNAVHNPQGDVYYEHKGYTSTITVYRLEGDEYVPWLILQKGAAREDYPEMMPRG